MSTPAPPGDPPSEVDLSKEVLHSTKERVIEYTLAAFAVLSVLTTLTIAAVLVYESLAFFGRVSIVEFFTETRWTPEFADKHFGIWPLLAGTLLITGIAAVVAMPLGLASAIYISEYAAPRVRKILKPSLEVLAGVPTVVYGYFALTFVTPLLKNFLPGIHVFNALSAGLVVGIMIVPMIASLSEDALRAVPRTLPRGAYALGATKIEVVTRVMVPSALSGIMASFILAISRAIGETMIVTLAAGATANLTANPLEPVRTMTAYIVQMSFGDIGYGSIEYQSIFAVGLLLFVLTLLMNILSQKIVRGYQEQY
jgi:phosphate transport system permease protein